MANTIPDLCDKIIFIPARELQIVDGHNPSNWKWYFLPHGQEVAHLIGDNVLDITGKIETRRLTKPLYGVFFVFKLDTNHQNIDVAYAAVGKADKGHLTPLAKSPIVRNDNWHETALGVYHPKAEGGKEQLLPLRLWGIDDNTYKSGLIVKGIELRPLQPLT